LTQKAFFGEPKITKNGQAESLFLKDPASQKNAHTLGSKTLILSGIYGFKFLKFFVFNFL